MGSVMAVRWPQILALEEMMKALVKKIAYGSPAIIMCAIFAMMAWMDYSSDGDRVNLALAVVLTVLPILGFYREFFHKEDEGK